MMDRKPLPTLSDVAAAAGVSLATASRVLNGSKRKVAEKYRRRVIETAREIGYSTNFSAQAIARGTSRMAALLLSDIADPYFSSIASGVARATTREDLLVTMAVTERGYKAMKELMAETGSMPQLVFAVNDVMAIGALTALRDAGLDVPGLIAVAGFDDIPAAKDAYPALTTVAVDLEALGERAVQLALRGNAEALEGGIALSNGDRLMPDPILVGRNAGKIEELAVRLGVERWTTDLDGALANPTDSVFFDAATTSMRPELLKKAMDAGKHVYCEKPISESLETAMDLARYAKVRGIKNGVVHDKLDLPGIAKLRRLRDSGFFGDILSVRGEFGYWVFTGDMLPAQRPSWNYRRADGGGIISDMLCHWRYVLDNVIAPVRAVSCLGANHIKRRRDENGELYDADADDAAYATFELEGGIVAHINSSWCVRVRRDDLVTFQVDGTRGSAVAGLHKCFSQHRTSTPKPVWNPDQPQTHDFFSDWAEVPDNQAFDNGFKVQWEDFLRHVVQDTPWQYSLLEGAKGVQLVECGMQSWRERRWVDVPQLEL
eukprot:jgi/Tetstr1/451933/TSEL_038969.t1